MDAEEQITTMYPHITTDVATMCLGIKKFIIASKFSEFLEDVNMTARMCKTLGGALQSRQLVATLAVPYKQSGIITPIYGKNERYSVVEATPELGYEVVYIGDIDACNAYCLANYQQSFTPFTATPVSATKVVILTSDVMAIAMDANRKGTTS